MVSRWATLAFLIIPALSGCADLRDEPSAPSSAQSLWSARTPYAGDNSRVAALVHVLSPGPEASYSISLQTANTPYTLTIEMEHLGKPFDGTDFSEQATLLLGLVDNLDEVSVTSHGQAYSLSAPAASKELGYDVKELGRDKGRLTAYVSANSD